MIGEGEMRARLQSYCDDNGGVAAVAKRWRITRQAIHQTLNGERPVSKHMAKRIGWELTPAYVNFVVDTPSSDVV